MNVYNRLKKLDIIMSCTKIDFPRLTEPTKEGDIEHKKVKGLSSGKRGITSSIQR